MKRMQLKLYGETEEQEQVLAEFKLKREMQRTKLSKLHYNEYNITVICHICRKLRAGI